MTKKYVYAHVPPGGGEAFYIGKGHGERAWNTGTRSNSWWATVTDLEGFEVRFLAVDLSDEEAIALEEAEIRRRGRYIDGGPLTNVRITPSDPPTYTEEWKRRPIVVGVDMSQTEKRLIEEAAAIEGEGRGLWVRRVLFKEARKLRRIRDAERKDESDG